jgi:hypothetical protein
MNAHRDNQPQRWCLEALADRVPQFIEEDNRLVAFTLKGANGRFQVYVTW